MVMKIYINIILYVQGLGTENAGPFHSVPLVYNIFTYNNRGASSLICLLYRGTSVILILAMIGGIFSHQIGVGVFLIIFVNFV